MIPRTIPASTATVTNAASPVNDRQQRGRDRDAGQDQAGPGSYAPPPGQPAVAEPTQHLTGAAETQRNRGDLEGHAPFGRAAGTRFTTTA